ncbi:exonuclease [Pseudomonas phage Athelas]|nr:exonuclease [Pseudomonas phage Athelas]
MSKLKVGLAFDMDYLIFSAMSAAEEEVDWGEDVWTLNCDHKKARDILFGTIKTIKADIAGQLKRKYKLAPEAYEFVDLCILSGDDNWRKDVLETYKANRKGKRKPVGYPHFCQGIMDHFGEHAYKWHGVEGDDVCGILMTKPELAGCDRVVSVSCDKDFNTVPGYFFWLTQMELVKNDEATADLHHMYQTLKGDTTDGYGGCPGVGEAFGGGLWEWLQDPEFFYQATKVMKSGARKGEEVAYWTSCKRGDEQFGLFQGPDLWACMASLAAKQGMSEEDLIVQAQVARILRASDWDFENKRPILWRPHDSSLRRSAA